MLSIIMSAIVYGHYMEALVPGSFQENVSEVYRLNGLKTVKFPPPTMTTTVMEAYREIFRERSKEETQREAEKEGSGTRASRETGQEMDLDDEVIEHEGRSKIKTETTSTSQTIYKGNREARNRSDTKKS